MNDVGRSEMFKTYVLSLLIMAISRTFRRALSIFILIVLMQNCVALNSDRIITELKNGIIKYDGEDIEGDLYLNNMDLDAIILTNCNIYGKVHIINSNGRFAIDFKGTNFHEDVLFENVYFVNSVNFCDAHFREDASFINNIFESGPNVRNTTFWQKANFNDNEFHKHVDLSNANFLGIVSFDGTTFEDGADFENANFKQNARFEGAAFGGEQDTTFGYCKFDGGADFTGVTFGSIANFESAFFAKPADFTDAIFSGNLYFKNAKFEEGSNFENTKFIGISDFSNSHFSRNAIFLKPSFEGNTNFVNALFQGNCDFEYAKFTGLADFSNIRINNNAKFTNSIFYGTTNFLDSSFGGRSDFTNTKFKSDVSFEGAAFNGLSSFKSVTFDEVAKFAGTFFNRDLDLSGVTINNKVYLDQADFGYSAKISFDYLSIDLSSGQLYIDWDSIKTRLALTGESISGLKHLEKNLRNIGQNEDADELYIIIEDLESEGTMDVIKSYVTGYNGARPLHALIVIFSIIMLYSLVYMWVDVLGLNDSDKGSKNSIQYFLFNVVFSIGVFFILPIAGIFVIEAKLRTTLKDANWGSIMVVFSELIIGSGFIYVLGAIYLG